MEEEKKRTPKDKPKDLVCIDEVAYMLRVGIPTVHKIIKQGQIPTYKVGGTTMVDEGKLYEWVMNNMEGFEA